MMKLLNYSLNIIYYNSGSPNLVMAPRLGRGIMRVQIPHPRPISVVQGSNPCTPTNLKSMRG